MLQSLRKKIKLWAVLWVFRTYFGSFLYPFEKADISYKKLPAHKKAVYLKAIHDWVNSEAYRLESQEVIRKFYQELALKPHDDVLTSAYRVALLVEQDKQKRLLAKAKEYNEIVDIT